MTGADAFALRRQGRHAEALAMARTLYAADPGNPWNLNALRWSMHSVIKQMPAGEAKSALVREFMALPYSETDDYVLKARAGYEKLVGDHSAEWQQAVAASKAGDWRLAMTRYRELAALKPGEERIETALAWELCRAIQYGLKEDAPDVGTLWRHVEDYMRLEAISKPSVIHSRMLQWVGIMAKKGLAPKFCDFLVWWNPEKHFRPEDRVGRPDPQGGRYDSVVETAIAGAAKTLQSGENEPASRKAAEFIVRHVPDYPDREWLPYYRACAQLLLGRPAEAREPLIRLVRAKMTEYWAWEKLASTFPEKSLERLQCLCRAVRCPCPKEAYWVGLHESLGAALVSAGHLLEGRHHLEKSLDLRQRNNWPVHGRLAELLADTDDAEPVDSSRLVEQLAEDADELLMDGIPARRGVVTGVDVELERDGQKRRFHFLCVEGDRPGVLIDCRVPANRAFGMLSGKRLGDPLSVRLDGSGPHPKVLSVRPRPEGAAWDVMPEWEGPVDHVNTPKALVAVRLNGGTTALVHFDRFPEAVNWKAGDVVRIRYSKKDDRIRVLAAHCNVAGISITDSLEEVPF